MGSEMCIRDSLNGFMLLTNSSFVSLREAYATETQQIWDMFRGRFQIKVSDGVLELSPPEQDLLKAQSQTCLNLAFFVIRGETG